LPRTDTPGIALETRGEIGIVALNRPEALNAVTPEMADALTEYFTQLRATPAVRVVILRSEGREFCAGADLGSDAFAGAGEGRAQRQMAMQLRYSGIVRAMRQCPQPIIALVQGAACGAGFSLALAADVRLAGPHAKMNAAYLKVGLGGCDMGSGYLLPRLVGLSVASELLLTGRFIEAERAKAVGLVSDVVPQEQLFEAGLALAAEMLAASPMSLRMTKETLNLAIDAPSLEAALTMEDRQQVILLETADHREAVAAFRGRRAPKYEDK
jgi:enoyl-CoA hydratase/carnithine racemase